MRVRERSSENNLNSDPAKLTDVTPPERGRSQKNLTESTVLPREQPEE